MEQRVRPGTPRPLISPQAQEENEGNNNHHLIGALTAPETVPMVTRMSPVTTGTVQCDRLQSRSPGSVRQNLAEAQAGSESPAEAMCLLVLSRGFSLGTPSTARASCARPTAPTFSVTHSRSRAVPPLLARLPSL